MAINVVDSKCSSNKQISFCSLQASNLFARLNVFKTEQLPISKPMNVKEMKRNCLCVGRMSVVNGPYKYLLKCLNLLSAKNFSSDLTNKLGSLFSTGIMLAHEWYTNTHRNLMNKIKGFQRTNIGIW